LTIEKIVHSLENTSSFIQIKDFKTGSDPNENVKEICEWILSSVKQSGKICKVGISNFGPLVVNKNDSDYGKILNSPKPAWKWFNVVEAFSTNLKIEMKNIRIEVDVGCAAFLESSIGNHKVDSLAYITIGTGVGIGIFTNGQVIQGLQHPEGGHMRVSRHEKDNFIGSCPLHKDCLEGYITNGAIKERKSLNSVEDCININDDDEIWEFISYYIAQACLNLLYLVSVEKIIIGGGIINRIGLIQKVQTKFVEANNNYITHELLQKENVHNYIVQTQFKKFSGILSAFALII
jgi:fructokinase